MELNEYESKLWSSLKYQEGEFERWQIPEILTEFYGSLESEDSVTKAMVAVSYLKRLLKKVMDKRGIEYDALEKVDLDTLVNTNLNKYEPLVGLDVSQVADENALSDSIDVFTSEFDYDKFESFSQYFKFFFSSIHNFMSKTIAPLIEHYGTLCDEAQDPVVSDPFLTTVFESNGNSDAASDDLWDSSVWGTFDFSEEDYNDGLDITPEVREEIKITDEELKNYLRFINSVFDIVKVRTSLVRNLNALSDKVKKRKVDIYFSDEEFMQKFRAIMEHDKKSNRYRFHGTDSLESAQSICEQGLGVMRDDLDSTTYSELSMEEVIVHQRGLGGEIGSAAYVIIDEPNGVEVLESLSEEETFSLVGSGLQGLDVQANNIVRSKYIVGYVDKLNRDIVFNPEYYDYQRFAEFSNKKM